MSRDDIFSEGRDLIIACIVVVFGLIVMLQLIRQVPHHEEIMGIVSIVVLAPWFVIAVLYGYVTLARIAASKARLAEQDRLREAEVRKHEMDQEQLQKEVPIRADGLVELLLLKYLEQRLGCVSWREVRHLPRFAGTVTPPPQVLPVILELSARFQRGAVSKSYSMADAAQDSRLVYSPTLPLFIEASTDIETKLKAQTVELLFLARVLRVFDLTVGRRDVIGAGNHTEPEIVAIFRSLLTMDRSKAEHLLTNVEQNLAKLEQRGVAAKAKRAAVSRAKATARLAIMEGLQQVCEQYGEVFSYESSVCYIDQWLERQVGDDIHPRVCLEHLERSAIIHHGQRLLEELSDNAPPMKAALLRSRLSKDQPIQELRRLLEELRQFMDTCGAEQESPDDMDRKVEQWRTDVHGVIDLKYADEIQAAMAKEKFDNNEYWPKKTELLKRKAGV